MMWGYGPGIGHVGIAEWIWIIAIAAFWVLLVVLLVLGVRWLLRADRGHQAGPPPNWTPPPAAPRPDDPLEILRQRYARGEIDDEEYERRRKTLSGG